MFYYCRSLKFLNLSNFDTSKAISMNGMFQGCFKLESLNISNFNTLYVNDFSYMFELSVFSTFNPLFCPEKSIKKFADVIHYYL
jgi:surface protein